MGITRRLPTSYCAAILTALSSPAPLLAQTISDKGKASAVVVEPTSLTQVREWVVGAPACGYTIEHNPCAGQFVLRTTYTFEFSLSVEYGEKPKVPIRDIQLSASHYQRSILENARTKETLISIIVPSSPELHNSSEPLGEDLLIQVSYL